jgi:hypothetical protein
MPTPSKTEFDEVFVETEFSDSVSITFDDLILGEITDVVSSILEDSINITFTTDTVSISGKYTLELFDQHVLKYITRGSSNRFETERITDDFSKIDANTEQIFDYSPDSRNMITITYTIETTEGDVEVTQDVFNNYSIGRDQLEEYI